MDQSRTHDPAKKLSTGKQTACSHGEFLELYPGLAYRIPFNQNGRVWTAR